MKHLLLPAAVLSLLLALSLWTGAAVRRDAEAWQQTLAEASEASERGDLSRARESLEAFRVSWDARQMFYHIVAEHDELDNAEELLARAQSALERKNGGDFAAETAALAVQLRVLAEMQSLLLGNVL